MYQEILKSVFEFNVKQKLYKVNNTVSFSYKDAQN